jgi:tetratricopeptide (TPR) repeat protein
LADLVKSASEETDGSAQARKLLRAVHVVTKFDAEQREALLARAYAVDGTNKQVAALYETLMSEQGRFAALEQTQQQIVQQARDRSARGALALAYGARWVFRHQNLDVGARFLEESFKLDSENESAFLFLRESVGKKAGNWDALLTLAEEAATRATGANAAFVLAQAGTIAWRQLGNLMRARASFERLSAVAPDHPQLRAFEAQIGETLKPVQAKAPEPSGRSSRTPAASVDSPAVDAEKAPEVAPQRSELASQPQPVALVQVDEGRLTELRQLAQKQETAKRYNEYVKTLLQLAALAPDPAEKVSLYAKAADLYVSKFANHAEAVKAYEAVLGVEPDNVQAADYLRQMYEKRRDWEKLLGLQRREAERLPLGPERSSRFFDIAKLAMERVKKPDVCIDLWQEVLSNDPSNAEALASLAGLYERAKDYDKLAAILEQQAESTADVPARIQVLAKLGALYGDRLANEEGAIDAWRSLLALDPNDRRAQDALKKKYLALGRWDDLEVFYAESGKWDEFIRLLEQQETKEAATQAKISLLFKIAQLWADKRQKLDRAAKSYERVLELDNFNLQAAAALAPIYSSANNAKALAGVLEVKLRHEQDSSTKLGKSPAYTRPN